MLDSHWQAVREGLERSSKELLAELEFALGRLEAIHDALEAPKTFDPESLESLVDLESCWIGLQKAHFEVTRQGVERAHLVPKMIEAFRAFRQGLDDLARRSPRMLQLTGQELGGALREAAGRKPWTLTFSRGKRLLAMSPALVHQCQKESVIFIPLAEKMLATLCEGASSLLRRWRRLSTHWCSQILDGTSPLTEAPSDWDRASARKALLRLRRHCAQLPRAWARALLAAYGRPAGKIPPREATLHLQQSWAEMLARVQSGVTLQRAIGRAMHCQLHLLRQLEVSLCEELGSLNEELGGLRSWVNAFDGQALAPEPPREAQVTPALNRLSQYQQQLIRRLEDISTREFGSELALRWPLILQSSVTAEAPRVGRLLDLVENDHRRLLQALEQAREVISHSRQSEGMEQEQILVQAVTNVSSLLQYWDAFEPEWKRLIQPSAACICAAFYLDLENSCEATIWQHLHYSARRFLRGARERGDGLSQVFFQFSQRAWERGAQLTGQFLNRIGWSAAPVSTYEAVIRRPGLTTSVSGIEEVYLPAIYRRLFRMDAVSDARFLIGRERELAALDEAYGLWQENRLVSVLVTGHRGSGKTSLVNCAFRQLPAEVCLLRGDFSQRCNSPEDLERQLCALLGFDLQADLLTELASSQRIIVLEEVERTFLRKIGGYEAARRLLRLIACTSQTTLWVLVMNLASFELLHSALAFGDSFSHRIDTTAVPAEILRRAVLSRHNLSGMRLQFPTPAKYRWWRPTLDGESEYFKAFAARTDGVFRTAFEVWQGQIEKVQAGVIYMAKIETRGLTRAVEVLDLQDLFLLVAILQHGSLKAEEISQIFSLSPAACQAQIDELVARELIAADPKYPGVRIRPEAGPVVRAVLYQKNML